MITNVLVENAALVPVVLLSLALVCVGIGYAALRSTRYGVPVLWALVALSVLAVFALTLVPTGVRMDQVMCTVQFSLPRPGSVELLANVALFFAPVFFATLATHRPLSMLLAGTTLSAAIETVQAHVPAIARACDTNDWLMNTTGAVAGVLLACGTTALTNRRRANPPAPRLPS